MEVKGIAIRSTQLFVRQRFPDRLEEWLDALPASSRQIVAGRIAPSGWYPFQEGFVLPTQKICDLFFGGEPAGAWEIGRFSAEFALWGLLRLFVRFGSPSFLVHGASRLFCSYYRPSQMVAGEISDGRAVAQIVEFPEPNRLIEQRIGGWIERAFEIHGCKVVTVRLTRSMAAGDSLTEVVAEWR